MPNHIKNVVSFENVPKERAQEVLQAIQDDDFGPGSIDFNKIIPMPDYIYRGNLGMEERQKYGANNWYDWSISNWGTKWNAYEPELYTDGDTITFYTAWSAPHPVLAELSRQFPEVLVYHRWCDEDIGNNVGEREYLNGEIIYENIPPAYSKEAYEMAASIMGCDLEELGYRVNVDGNVALIEEEPEVATEKITVVLVRANEKAEIAEIGADLDSMREVVGGFIEAVYPFEEEVAIVCNEEGKLLELPLNRALRDEDGEIYDIIAGDFFVCGLNGMNFGSLTEEQQKRYLEMFKYPERFLKVNHQIIDVPIVDRIESKKQNFER